MILMNFEWETQNGLKWVAVGATGLLNNEPETQLCGVDIFFKKTSRTKVLRFGWPGDQNTRTVQAHLFNVLKTL